MSSSTDPLISRQKTRLLCHLRFANQEKSREEDDSVLENTRSMTNKGGSVYFQTSP